jgi:hypothetical protein
VPVRGKYRAGRSTAPGEGDCLGVEIGREDTHDHGIDIVAQEFLDKDRQRIGFLTGRAASRPDAQLARRAGVVNDPRQSGFAQVLE